MVLRERLAQNCSRIELTTTGCSCFITKRLRQILNARHSRFESALVIKAQWFRFGGQRCSHLNAALNSLTIVF